MACEDFSKGHFLCVIILFIRYSMKDCIVEVGNGIIAGDSTRERAIIKVLLHTKANEALGYQFTVRGAGNISLRDIMGY